MMTYLCSSVSWSVMWFALGYGVCWLETQCRNDDNYRGKHD